MFRTVAAGSVGGAYVDYSAGVQPGTLITASDKNMTQEELCHLVEAVGWALDSADSYQVLRSSIALSHQIGEVLMPELKLTPITVAASRSTTNPGFPLYLPIIDRTDADHDVASTQAPDLVTAFRAYAANILGSASFTATWAGSVGTFANTTVNNALLRAISEDALVQRWLSSSQSATYAGSGEDFSNGRCLNVAGTDFAITAINTGARTITVTGTPTAGSQTVIFYPYRIAGSSTSVRLHRLSGFVPVASGDSDGVEIDGMRHMDAGQGHWHDVKLAAITYGQVTLDRAADASGTYTKLVGTNSPSSSPGTMDVASPRTDGTNGTPRTGKTTNPRSHSRRAYTWVQRLLT